MGISSSTSWQDLKDWARQAGESVVYGDVYVDNGRRIGIVEYGSRDDYEYAIKRLGCLVHIICICILFYCLFVCLLASCKLHGHSLRIFRDGEAPTVDQDRRRTGDGSSGGSVAGADDGERGSRNTRKRSSAYNRERPGHRSYHGQRRHRRMHTDFRSHSRSMSNYGRRYRGRRRSSHTRSRSRSYSRSRSDSRERHSRRRPGGQRAAFSSQSREGSHESQLSAKSDGSPRKTANASAPVIAENAEIAEIEDGMVVDEKLNADDMQGVNATTQITNLSTKQEKVAGTIVETKT